MLMSNIEIIPGKTITVSHGIVSGSTVRAKHVGRDIMAGLKNMALLHGYQCARGLPFPNEFRRQLVDCGRSLAVRCATCD